MGREVCNGEGFSNPIVAGIVLCITKKTHNLFGSFPSQTTMTRAVIVGTGDHAYGIAHLFHLNNTEQSGNLLEVTKPGLSKEQASTFHDTNVPITEWKDAISRADICILAIPAAALHSFVTAHMDELKDKILVDATNSSEEDLDSLLGISNMRWVKAFNDFGAVDVLLKKPTSKKIASSMTSPSLESLQVVKEFAEASLGLDIKRVPYEHYSAIVGEQMTIGKDWISATVIMLIVFGLCQFYNILRYVMLWIGQYPVSLTQFHQTPCREGLSLVQLPPLHHEQGHLLGVSQRVCFSPNSWYCGSSV